MERVIIPQVSNRPCGSHGTLYKKGRISKSTENYTKFVFFSHELVIMVFFFFFFPQIFECQECLLFLGVRIWLWKRFSSKWSLSVLEQQYYHFLLFSMEALVLCAYVCKLSSWSCINQWRGRKLSKPGKANRAKYVYIGLPLSAPWFTLGLVRFPPTRISVCEWFYLQTSARNPYLNTGPAGSDSLVR